MPGLGDLIDSLDPDVRLRGVQFESICKWFLTHDPGYRRELKTVWLWDEWPGRWGADAGIDLVAETHAGICGQSRPSVTGLTVPSRNTTWTSS